MEQLVAVVGPGDADATLRALAEQVGEGLGRRGVGVVCGGLGGVMEAACRGARRAGGPTVGLLPGLDPRAANAYVDVAVPTGLGEVRNILVVRAGAAVIAVGGGYGTLSEVAFALKHGTPVVGLETWDPPAGGRTGVHVVASATAAVERALELVGGPTDRTGAP